MDKIIISLLTALYFVLVILIHEIGHLFGFWIVGKKTIKISWKWYGFSAGEDNLVYVLTPFKAFIVYISGILLGFILIFPLVIIGELNIFISLLLYGSLCIGDIVAVVSITFLLKNKEKRKLSLIENMLDDDIRIMNYVKEKGWLK